jgi:hypothetical protein
LIDPEVELFLSVHANAFFRALRSQDAHTMHTVIQNTRQVIEDFENKAFNASIKTLGEGK